MGRGQLKRKQKRESDWEIRGRKQSGAKKETHIVKKSGTSAAIRYAGFSSLFTLSLCDSQVSVSDP